MGGTASKEEEAPPPAAAAREPTTKAVEDEDEDEDEERPATEEKPMSSFFTFYMLCGGGDVIEQREKKRKKKAAARAAAAVTAPAAPGLNEAVRAQESADLFVREFKNTMKTKGFAATKYARNGKASSRVYMLDPTESKMMWRSKKASTKENTDIAGYDSVALAEITEVARGGDGRRALSSAKSVTLHTPQRKLVIGFDSDSRCEMFADGMALLIAEARTKARPRTGGVAQPTQPAANLADAFDETESRQIAATDKI